MDFLEFFRQQSITAHAHPDPWLSHLKHQHYACHCYYSANCNQDLHPRNIKIPFLKNKSQRIADIGKFGIDHSARQNQRQKNRYDQAAFINKAQNVTYAIGYRMAFGVSAFEIVFITENKKVNKETCTPAIG